MYIYIFALKHTYLHLSIHYTSGVKTKVSPRKLLFSGDLLSRFHISLLSFLFVLTTATSVSSLNAYIKPSSQENDWSQLIPESIHMYKIEIKIIKGLAYIFLKQSMEE